MFMEEVMERTLGRVPSIREVIERAGETGAWVLIVEMEEEEDMRDLLEE